MVDFSHIFTYNISTRHKRKDVKPVHSAIDIANFFIDITRSKEEGYITDLKVNKLLYFAQAWSLVRLGRPLFDESIEAWPLGPVVPNVYNAFKKYKSNNITKVHGTYSPDIFSDEELQLLIDIQREYGKYAASTLVDMTHKKGSPWEQVYDGSKHVISNDSIKEYFIKENPLGTFDTHTIEHREAVGYRDPSDGLLVLPVEYNDDCTM